MAENGNRRSPEQSASETRESTPRSELGTPELSSSSSTISERSEPDTLPDSQHTPYVFPRIATNSGRSTRAGTPLSQASDNNENGANDNGNGNGDMRDNVTVAGSLTSSEGHDWPFGTRDSTPATIGNGEDNRSEVGSERNGGNGVNQFERSTAPSPASHTPTSRESTSAAETEGSSLDTVEEENAAVGDEEPVVGGEVLDDVLDSIESDE